MTKTLAAPPTETGEAGVPHWLICELAAKAQVPAETLIKDGVTAKPSATVPKRIREREPHLPARLPAVMLPLIPLSGEAPEALTYRAANRWRTADDKSVKWHSRCRIADHHLVIAPGGQPCGCPQFGRGR